MIENNDGLYDAWVRLGDVATKVVTQAVEPPDRVYQGQAYWRRGEETHTKLDGTPITLDRWFTFCAVCCEPFEFTAVAYAPSLTRRCKLHRMPGVKVGSKAERERLDPL